MPSRSVPIQGVHRSAMDCSVGRPSRSDGPPGERGVNAGGPSLRDGLYSVGRPSRSDGPPGERGVNAGGPSLRDGLYCVGRPSRSDGPPWGKRGKCRGSIAPRWTVLCRQAIAERWTPWSDGQSRDVLPPATRCRGETRGGGGKRHCSRACPADEESCAAVA